MHDLLLTNTRLRKLESAGIVSAIPTEFSALACSSFAEDDDDSAVDAELSASALLAACHGE